MNESALKSIRAHIRQEPPRQHVPLAEGAVQVVRLPPNVAVPLPQSHKGNLTETHRLEFSKRVEHFRRLFGDAPPLEQKQKPRRIHGKATQTGRKLGDKPEPTGPHFKIG